MAKFSATIPNEPVATNASGSRNIHRLARRSPTVLVLQPGRTLWIAAIVFLGASPIILAICIAMQADLSLMIMLPLISLCGGIPIAVGALLFQLFGMRARFDRDQQHIRITGLRHGRGKDYSFSDIVAVQFCGAGIKESDVGEMGSRTYSVWHAYQVNLVVRGDTPVRVNLLDSGGGAQLEAIAKEIAKFLDVPFHTV